MPNVLANFCVQGKPFNIREVYELEHEILKDKNSFPISLCYGGKLFWELKTFYFENIWFLHINSPRFMWMSY